MGAKLFYSLETPRSQALCHEFLICLVGGFAAQTAGGSEWGAAELKEDEWASSEDAEVMGTWGEVTSCLVVCNIEGMAAPARAV